MVVPLGPGKFYGSSLPRPRIYTDVKYSSDRVDPPVPVSDPMMSWAQEAHWSMGGLSFKRFRLQGRIEGNVIRLRAQREKSFKKRNQSHLAAAANQIGDSDGDSDGDDYKYSSPSPPPAPITTKRKRFTVLIDEEEDGKEVDGGGEIGGRRKLARKLGNDFDRVAAVESGRTGGSQTVASRTRSRRSEEESDEVKVIEDVNKEKSKGKKLRRLGEIERERAKRVADNGFSTPTAGRVRTSPRLAMR